MPLSITLAGDFITTYQNGTNNHYLQLPAGHFIVLSAPGNKVTIRHTTNSVVLATNLSVNDIVTPAIGANTYEVYLEKLAQYLNGDNTIVF